MLVPVCMYLYACACACAYACVCVCVCVCGCVCVCVCVCEPGARIAVHTLAAASSFDAEGLLEGTLEAVQAVGAGGFAADEHTTTK